MKNFGWLYAFCFSVVLLSCSGEDSPRDDGEESGNIGNFIGYKQTYSQSGDVYEHSYADGKLLKTTINGQTKLEVDYNDSDQLVRMTEYVAGEVYTDLKYSYDSSGELSAVEEYDAESGNFVNRQINWSGDKLEVQKLNTTQANSGRVVFTFNNGRLDLFEDFNGSGTLLHSDDLSYDASGNVTQNSVYTFYEGLGSITEVFGYEYDDKANPLQYFFQNYTLPFLIFGSKQKLYNYEITTALRAFGPNNRVKNIYPSTYSENQKLDIEVEYDGDAIMSQTFIFRPEDAVIQYLEFLYSE